ncbi:unnamed protein product [Spirodela intermedia]|uniref:Auxin-responsive protein n=1 Tax=Spirodela intermedia TaxID=51605 RepID=A0A7I8ICS5_SPIIN|nr:unnamed protein product [Spirodela intermedia]CAA6655421.1 unnamed protein product [Spirodela intermedia]
MFCSGQVVGWPPVRTYRMNSVINHSKDSSEGNNNEKDCSNGASRCKITGHAVNIPRSATKEMGSHQQQAKKGPIGGSLFVKVNMDGMPIGRKVDLNSHHTYEALAMALEEMFQSRNSKANLLDGSSGFVLTYEDKDGDWMLVGDVPWGMFLSTVQRLRIMRAPDVRGLGNYWN